MKNEGGLQMYWKCINCGNFVEEEDDAVAGHYNDCPVTGMAALWQSISDLQEKIK